MAKKKKGGIISEFSEFISRGSVMDLAVGVIIGAAFSAIITSLVDDILMPLIGMLFGDFSVSGYELQLGPDNYLRYGNFIQSIITFFLIALFVFLLVKGINSIRRKAEELKNRISGPEEEEEENTPSAPTTDEILTEIRDLLKEGRK